MSSLTIHFLNVGKGNCTIIEFSSGRLSIVDIDNSRIGEDEEELTDPVDYVRHNFKGRSLFRFVLTHPDLDHMSGLAELARRVSISNFWDTEHDRSFDASDWEGSPYNPDDWKQYLRYRKSDDNPKCLRLYRDQTSDCCWTQDGVSILSPSTSLVRLANETEEYNHLSYVLRVEYGGRRILLGGDASIEAWDEILKHYRKPGLQADILLAPHHGSSNNIHEDALSAVAPVLTVVSVAEGVDYDRDFYESITKNKLVLSTKWWGNIRVEIHEDARITYDVEKKRE